jgi:thiamine biosynthesis lipoprotein ApbE
LSSTVLASSCTAADAMATALFVMGGPDGFNMLAGQGDLGGLLVEQGGVQRSLRFPA